jgi:N-methylhydantoinase B
MNTDRFTIDIIQNSIQAAADEMFAIMRRTAMSAIIYEVLDMGTGITDADGELAGSGAGIPTFIGMLDKAVKATVHHLRAQKRSLRSGDVYMTNDPNWGGVTHLNDIILLKPVFAENQLVAWTANAAHWNDIGGMAPGSMSVESREIYQEGLRLPAVQVCSADHLEPSVVDLLQANSRLPDYLLGDLWAGIAALNIGEQRILELISKFGADMYEESVKQYLDYGEQITLNGLKKIPSGTYQFEEVQEDQLRIKAKITITPERFTVNLEDNPSQQATPFNLSHDATVIAAQMVLKAVTGAQLICNGGSFRPLKVKTRPGTIFNASSTAPMGFYYETRIRLYDFLLRTLATHMPERIPAGHFASICGTMIGGIHPETGRQYSIIEPQVGGWGGSTNKDGNTAMFSACHGETYNCPVEITERRNGVLVNQLRLNSDPGGAGQFRGGNGIVAEYKILSPQAWVTAAFTRHQDPPWGLKKGHSGSVNAIRILKPDGTISTHSKVSHYSLETGDVIQIITANGAGWGDPAQRPVKKIQADIKNQYVTKTLALQQYGRVE